MKLFGLKDEFDRAVAIEIDRIYTDPNHLWKIQNIYQYGYDPYKEPPPQFKAGEWCYYKNPLYKIETVFRVGQIYNTRDIGRFRVSDANSENWYELSDCRHATPQEIESHLKKICDEKYIGKKVRSLYSGVTDTIQRKQAFSFSKDQMWYEGTQFGILVYDKGKFADIVSDKKKLPKTKDELINIFLQWLNSPSDYPHTSWRDSLYEFFNKYED